MQNNAKDECLDNDMKMSIYTENNSWWNKGRLKGSQSLGGGGGGMYTSAVQVNSAEVSNVEQSFGYWCSDALPSAVSILV